MPAVDERLLEEKSIAEHRRASYSEAFFSAHANTKPPKICSKCGIKVQNSV